MKKSRKPESFIKSPEYPGGPKALKQFILQNLQYPDEALQNRVEGTVRLRVFINDKSGIVEEVQVISPVKMGCTEEAIRLAKLLVFDTDPPKGVRISYQKVLNIPFKLPKPPKQTGFNVQYSVTKDSVNKQEKSPPKSKNTYGYTITLN